MKKNITFLGIFKQKDIGLPIPGFSENQRVFWKIWEGTEGNFVARQVCCSKSQTDTVFEENSKIVLNPESSLEHEHKKCVWCDRPQTDPITIPSDVFFEQYRIVSSFDVDSMSFVNENGPLEQERNALCGESKEDCSDTECQKITEDELRVIFDSNIARLDNERFSAIRELRKIIAHPGSFSEIHKNMFTDFGFILRKCKLFELAASAHQRAMELSPEDEHIVMNLARVLYDAGDIGRARDYLLLAVKLNPTFAQAHEFLLFLNS